MFFVNENCWLNGTFFPLMVSRSPKPRGQLACFLQWLGWNPHTERLCWSEAGLLSWLFCNLRRFWGRSLLRSPAFLTGSLQKPEVTISNQQGYWEQIWHSSSFTLQLAFKWLVDIQQGLEWLVYNPSTFLLSCWAGSKRRACISGNLLEVQWFSALVYPIQSTWETFKNPDAQAHSQSEFQALRTRQSLLKASQVTVR